MSIGVKGVTSLGGIVAWRFFLGVVEAGFFPGVMLLMSCWYKPAELSKRVAMFYTASLISGAFGGLLAGGIITGLDGKAGTPGWKWLFIIEGLITMCLATVAFFVLPGKARVVRYHVADRLLRLPSYDQMVERVGEAAVYLTNCGRKCLGGDGGQTFA